MEDTYEDGRWNYWGLVEDPEEEEDDTNNQ